VDQNRSREHAGERDAETREARQRERHAAGRGAIAAAMAPSPNATTAGGRGRDTELARHVGKDGRQHEQPGLRCEQAEEEHRARAAKVAGAEHAHSTGHIRQRPVGGR
jgi:hypothetical protein